MLRREDCSRGRIDDHEIDAGRLPLEGLDLLHLCHHYLMRRLPLE